MAADLAGHRAGPDHPAHSAIEGLRPGLSAQQRLPRRHGAGAVPLHHGVPAEPERLRLGHRAWPVRHRHGPLRAPIPVAAGARSAVSASVRAGNVVARKEERRFHRFRAPIAPASPLAGGVLWGHFVGVPDLLLGLRDPQAGA